MENLGRSLKEARENKDITLKEASQVTKIGTGFLKALENNEYDIFPSHIYLRYFLKSYANFLGLNGEKLASEFKSFQFTLPKNPPQPRRRISKYAKKVFGIFVTMISIWVLWVIYQTLVVKF